MDFKREKYIFSSYDCVGKKRKYLFVLYFYSILCFLSNYQKYFEQTVFYNTETFHSFLIYNDNSNFSILVKVYQEDCICLEGS